MAGIVLNNISKMFIGNTEVDSLFLGNTKIYEKQSRPVPGLYDANDNLIATYAESGLIADADYTSTDYKTEPGSGYCTMQRYTTCKKIILPNSIARVGIRAFCVCTGLLSITIPSSVTYIGSGAFYKCTGLTSITIPRSVNSIGENAFQSCAGLISITIESGNTTYHSVNNCVIKTATKELVLGCKRSIIPAEGSVTSISNAAFSGCTGLTSITIPDSVNSIGENVFYGCTGLTFIIIPNSVTSIGFYAFRNCTGLTLAIFNGTPTTIASNTFTSDTSLTDIYVPWTEGTVAGAPWGATNATIHYTSLNNTFWRLNSTPNLSQSLNFPASGVFENYAYVTSKCAYTDHTSNATHKVLQAQGCNSIEVNANGYVLFCATVGGVQLPDTFYCYNAEVYTVLMQQLVPAAEQLGFTVDQSYVTPKQGYYYVDMNEDSGVITVYNTEYSVIRFHHATFDSSVGFYDWVSTSGIRTQTITIDNDVTSIGDEAFDGCEYLTSINIPDSVTSIGRFAFDYCRRLTSITIPNSVTSIGESAFCNCWSLTSIMIPDSVKSIGGNAFLQCFGLISATIGNDVTNIGSDAFKQCTNLTSVIFTGTPTTIFSNTFAEDTALADIYVPWSEGAVAGAPWGATNAIIHYNHIP